MFTGKASGPDKVTFKGPDKVTFKISVSSAVSLGVPPRRSPLYTPKLDTCFDAKIVRRDPNVCSKPPPLVRFGDVERDAVLAGDGVDHVDLRYTDDSGRAVFEAEFVF